MEAASLTLSIGFSLRVTSATVSLPKPGRLPWANEDAVFAAHPFYGVFDGVSSARNSRAYARQLAGSSKAALQSARDDEWPSAARTALTKAAAAAAKIEGASTASLLKVDTTRRLLFSYNLGDSGFLLFAPVPEQSSVARISARSARMVHSGGSPYQLAGGSCGYITDKPSDGRGATHPLLPGCVAVLHSDGLLDNLSLEEVGAIIASKQPSDVAGIARTLATKASERKLRPDDISVTAIAFASGGSTTKAYGRRAVATNAVLALGVVSVTAGGTSGDAAAPAADSSDGSELRVTDVIRIYGRLAGRECFGKAVPTAAGASCQMTVDHAVVALGLHETAQGIDEGQFLTRLEALQFEWPLKPWGAAKSDSNAKTVTVNKSAETSVFMAELERRELYDRRNPTGPLPTSLRSALDKQVQADGVDAAAARKCFRALLGGDVEPGALLTAERLERTIRVATGGERALDYYSFQTLVTEQSRIVWTVAERGYAATQ